MEALFGASVIELLDQLVNKSLVVVEESASNNAMKGETRYRLLGTVRQYAHEALKQSGEYERLHNSHLAYFADMVQSAQSDMHGPLELEWLDRLDAEIDNLRAALEWTAQTHDLKQGAHLVSGLWYWWATRGYLREGKRWSEQVLPDAISAGEPAARATAHFVLGELAMYMGYLALSQAHFEQAMHLATTIGDEHLMVEAGRSLGWHTRDIEQATGLLTESIRLARVHGLAYDAARAQEIMGHRLFWAGRPQEAIRSWSEALTGFNAMGNIYAAMKQDAILEAQAIHKGDLKAVHLACAQCVADVRLLKNPVELADALLELADADVRLSDDCGVASAIREAIVIFSKVGNQDRPAQCAVYMAWVACARGDAQGAVTLLAAADALWRPYRDHWIHDLMEELHRKLLARMRAELAPADFESAWSRGQNLTLKQTVDMVLAI